MRTKPLIEQHFHGCFGVDFNKSSVDDILYLSKEITKYGIGGIYPTLVTDSVENTKSAIAKIKAAADRQEPGMAKIFGVHLEGIFLNPEKKGIHNSEHFLELTADNFKLLEDDFIKIVTLAPELNVNLIEYLREKNIEVQAGHCVGGNLSGCRGTTHTFNAMSGITHRGKSTALTALTNDDLYTEVIADGIHVSDDALKLLFKVKPADKIILVSDSLPCAKSSQREFVFADEKVYYDGIRATSEDGTLAGSTILLSEIVKRLHSVGLFNPQYILNPYIYHNIDADGFVEWDDEYNIVDINF